MLSVLGQIGKALIPQLLTIGGNILQNSSLGSSLKKFGRSDWGQTLSQAGNVALNSIQQAKSVTN